MHTYSPPMYTESYQYDARRQCYGRPCPGASPHKRTEEAYRRMLQAWTAEKGGAFENTFENPPPLSFKVYI